MTQNNLIIKDVEFQGHNLKSAQDTDTNIIYVAVKWVCDGLGLTSDQIKNERKRIQSDLVLQKGGSNLTLPTSGGEQEILCLDIEFLPLWLAKISITPNMKNTQPKVVSQLIEYQLKAKDVLAKAFIHTKSEDSQLFAKLLSTMERNNALLEENNNLRPKAEQFDLFLESKGYISLNKAAKALKVGRNKMMAFLRSHSVLFLDGQDNLPYQKYVKSGYFTIDCHIGRDGRIHATTRVSSSGVSFIHKLYQKYAPSTDGRWHNMTQSLISLNTLVHSIDSKSIIIYLEGNQTFSHLCISFSKMNVTFEDVYLGLKSSEGIFNIDFNTITSIIKINKSKFKICTDELNFVIQIG